MNIGNLLFQRAELLCFVYICLMLSRTGNKITNMIMFWQYYYILKYFFIINVSERGQVISGSVFLKVAYKHRFISWGDLWAYRIYINPFRKYYLLCICIYIYQIFSSHLTSKYIHTVSTSYINASIRIPVTLFLLQSCHVSVVFISTWAIWSPFWLGTKSEYPVSLAHRYLNSYDTYERTFASA